MAYTGRSDPGRLDRIVRLLGNALPNAMISCRDRGEFGDVEFRIETDSGVGLLFLAWDLLQEDQHRTERFVEQVIWKLSPGMAWRLSIKGTATPTALPEDDCRAPL